MCLCASLRSYCRSMWWNHLRFWYGSTMVNLTGSKKDGWWVGHAADPCPCWMINISPVHGSAGFWISSSCSIPVFFVGPIPMSAGKTKKQCVSICLSFYIMFLHPRSDYVTKKYSIYYIYRFLWVSSCFQLFFPTSRGLSKVPLSSQATDHVGTNIRSLGVDATSQPRLTVEIMAEIMAGGCRWSSNQTWQWKSGKVNKYNGY